MDQFGKFQKISSWFDPENPLMDVRNDSGRVTLLTTYDPTQGLRAAFVSVLLLLLPLFSMERLYFCFSAAVETLRLVLMLCL